MLLIQDFYVVVVVGPKQQASKQASKSISMMMARDYISFVCFASSFELRASSIRERENCNLMV